MLVATAVVESASNRMARVVPFMRRILLDSPLRPSISRDQERCVASTSVAIPSTRSFAYAVDVKPRTRAWIDPDDRIDRQSTIHRRGSGGRSYALHRAMRISTI